MDGYVFFTNKECPHLPCHEIPKGEKFVCSMCYCPLYVITKCGGKYSYTKQGIKDCSQCTLPHMEKGAIRILRKINSGE